MKAFDKRLLEILAKKPELILSFPRWMLSGAAIKEIRETENVAIAEVAGRDSIAAVIRACKIRPIQSVLPTIAYTGTEHGDWKAPFRAIEVLGQILEKDNIRTYSPIILGSPKFWWKLCGRYATQLFKTYGYYSHCVGCHFYFHAIRIPLAKRLHCPLIIGGERESHNGKIKINQTKLALDAYINFLKRHDIELFLPIRYIKAGEEIEEIIGQNWDEGDQQLECVLSKNYQTSEGSILFDEGAIKSYLEEFAFKIAEEFVCKKKI